LLNIPGPVSRVPYPPIAALAAIALSACAFSPLAHRIKVGEEPFVVFVGEGRDQHTDLFAVSANGGAVTQVTFTALVEQEPRLTPTGEMVAFLRMRDTAATEHRDVVLMNLQSGGERILSLPAEAGRPLAVAWSDDVSRLYIRTDRGLWQAAMSTATGMVTPIASAESAVADSAIDTWLGSPRFTRVIRCANGGMCIAGAAGDTTSLSSDGHDALRWGSDSVAWFQSGIIVVRSLGPGHQRSVALQDAPSRPRDATYASGPSIR